MITPKRVELVPVSGILSSYKKKYKPKERWDVEVFKEGAYVVPKMFASLRKLDELVRLNKGRFYVIDLFRSWETQAKAREAFESGKKKAFVAKPGNSFHNAGRAVDVSVKELGFEDVPRDEWLHFFWNLAIPLGFKPIIKIPDLDVSESWHFNFLDSDWKDAYSKVKYSEIVKCLILDAGKWEAGENKEKVKRMFIQSQLIRLGYFEIGSVDGVFGPKTNKVIEFLDVKDLDTETICLLLSKR